MDQAEVKDLATAVNRWLSYQRLCGRSALLSEAYLSQPIAEYLIQKHSGEFATEIDHPTLNNEAGPGRPRQMDYVLYTRDSSTIETAIECKWISAGPYDKQRIMNDILRLECVRVPDRHVKRYFLIAGKKENFEKHFIDLRLNTGSKRVPYTKHLFSFSLKRPKKRVNVRECDSHFRGFYREFERGFQSSLPVSFRTEFLSYRTADKISVGIWQISSVRNRRTFSAETTWSLS